MTGIVRVWSWPLVLTKAEVDCRSDCTRGSVNIDHFQGTSFGNAAGGVEANAEQGAIA
ncbi:hypothetical protein [Microcoleus sp. BROC3]|uniref:hypothetical protein n=1 Tax=Microcoleus sp. BROC3 TaxID=3055323 RepID=UPI002FD5AFFC